MLGSLPFKSILVIAPHPDDEALGAGGLISATTRARGHVHVIFAVVDGFHHYGISHPTTLEERVVEINKAASILGYSYEILYQGRNLIEKLDTVPQRDLVDAFERAINQYQPDLLVLPHGIDFDQDHIACFRAGFTAARPIPVQLGKHFPERVISFEMPKLTWSSQAFLPNLYLDITDYIERKLNAVAAYASQLREVPHVRSLSNIRALAHLRGSEAGVEHAEAFRIFRWVL